MVNNCSCPAESTPGLVNDWSVDTRGVASMAEWSGVNALLNDCSLCLSSTVDTRGVVPMAE